MNNCRKILLKQKIPKDAVLLIPGPEHENEPARYGIAPGYYNSKQLLELLDQHQHNADAILFIADMLETGNPKDDGFAKLLKTNRSDPVAIAKIVKESAK
jgi:hypothetical protein